MKKLLFILFLTGISSHAFAESISITLDNKQPLEIQLAAAALKGCMAETIPESQLADIEKRTEVIANQVKQHCQNKDEEKAYQLVAYHFNQQEAQTAIQCAQQLRPLLDSPTVKQAISKHMADVEMVLNGQIPRPICR